MSTMSAMSAMSTMSAMSAMSTICKIAMSAMSQIAMSVISNLVENAEHTNFLVGYLFRALKHCSECKAKQEKRIYGGLQ